ncbi:dihydrofolate reductase-like protein [Chaetomium strumarium]|uniref:Dihydrofolate reductase n=1 Tax=Chaetomium strumarium TaxID=1170767 RepID=A0AAJ0LY48_9PEZI|nr:dihydrofolate reductase-like protein [Chaetomium strumarium]
MSHEFLQKTSSSSSSTAATGATQRGSPLPEVTLIVAATAQHMGIGRAGSLPWPMLKREMAYFARVTRRLPPPVVPLKSESGGGGVMNNDDDDDARRKKKKKNAVVMGRKTWESIPERFRPLPGRWNVVLSTRGATTTTPTTGGEGAAGGVPEAVTAQSLEEALAYLRDVKQKKEGGGLGRVFVIGGAQIYRAALEMIQARRVLLTRVRTDFECDTFFPLKLDEDGAPGWRRASQAEMDAWVGEEVPRGVQSEAGTEYEFEMWERVD